MILLAVRQRARLIQHGQDARQVAVTHGIEWQSLRRSDIGLERRIGCGDRVRVDRIGLDKRPGTGQSHDPGQSGGANPKHERTSDRGGIARYKHRLAEYHVLKQSGQEVAAALFGNQGRSTPLIDAETPRHCGGQAVDRCAFLRARCQIDAAQQRGGIEAGASECFLDKVGQWILQARHLRRESGNQSPAVGAAFGVQSIKQAIVQSLHQQPELARKGRPCVFARPLGGECHAPDLAQAFSVHVGEKVGEPGQQIGFGEDGIDGNADAEFFVYLLDTTTDCRGVNRTLGRRGASDAGVRLPVVLQGEDHDQAVQRLPSAGAS